MPWKFSALKSNNLSKLESKLLWGPSLRKGISWCHKKHIDEMIFRKYSELFFFSVAAAFDNMSTTYWLPSVLQLLLSCLTKTRVAFFQIVKPFTRKLASDNLVSPIFFPLQVCNKESRKQNHQLHHNESMKNDENKLREKTCFQVEHCQRNEEEGNNVAVGKVYQANPRFLHGWRTSCRVQDHVLMNHMTRHEWIKTLSANNIN